MPEIIVDEYDYSYINKTIEDYRIIKIEEEYKAEERRIKRNKEIKDNEEYITAKLLEEKRKNAEEENRFKDEFIEKYDLIKDFFWHAKSDTDNMQKRMNIKIDNSIFIYLIRDMYKNIEDSKSIKEIATLLEDKLYIKKMIDETIIVSEPINTGYGLDSKSYERVHGLLSSNRDGSEKYILGYYSSKSTLYKKEDEPWDQNFRNILFFNYIYLIAIAFIRLLKLCRNKNDFINNEELYQMYLNLFKENNIDSKYISEKLYPLYTSFYIDAFKEKISYNDFYILVNILNAELDNDKLLIKLYKEDIKFLNINIKKELMDPNSNQKDTLIKLLKEFFIKINRRKFFQATDTEEHIEGLEEVYSIFYREMFKYIFVAMPYEVFYEFIDADHWKMIKLLAEIHKKEMLEEEKKRLLEGDMHKEDRYIKDKYSFENITTGYDFEFYLKDLFEGLGYDAEVTSGSNDQGADLIIRKNNKTTIVQAKYYSGSVGNASVQEVVGAIAYYGGDNGMVVTNSTFTKSAELLAKANSIELINGVKLEKIRKLVIEK